MSRTNAVIVSVSLLACACAAPSTDPAGQAPEQSAGRSTKSPLSKPLSTETLEGFVVVPSEAVFHSSAAAARSGGEAPRSGRSVRVVRVVADEGDVVKIRTELPRGAHASWSDGTRYELTLYVARTQLVPVLREPIVASFEDGSGYVLREGLPVRIDGAPRPEHETLARLHPAIESSQVGLSYVPADEAPSLDAKRRGVELGCEYEPKARGHRSSDWYDDEFSDEPSVARTYVVEERREQRRIEQEAQARARQAERREEERRRVEERRRRMAEAATEQDRWAVLGDLDTDIGLGSMDFGGSFGVGFEHERPTCTLVERRSEPGQAIHVGGRAFASPDMLNLDECDAGVPVHGGPGETVLVDLSFERAVVRASSSRNLLSPTGGCAGIALGGSRSSPSPRKRLGVRGEVNIYFPDGRLAGTHRGVTIVGDLEDRPAEGERLCIEHPLVSTQLCFDRADLEEVEVRP